MSRTKVSDIERGRLGLDAPISRRDFLNGSLAAAGGALALPAGSAGALALPAGSASADTFTGYGGVGDYARANGDTWAVVQAAHRLRDGDRISIGHSELNGAQHWGSALEYGRKAGERAAA